MHDRASPRVEWYQEWGFASTGRSRVRSIHHQNIRYQQNLVERRIAILELSTNDIARIRAAASLIEAALIEIQPNELRHVNIP